MSLTRRESLKALAAVPALGVQAAENTSGGSVEKETGLIDFRVRPPFGSFLSQSDAHLSRDDDKSRISQFVEQMDMAGIDMALIMGRTAPLPGPFRKFVANEDVSKLLELYPERFFGFGSVDVRKPGDAIREVGRCKALGLIGIAFDNPLSDPPLHNDDASLMPVYEACARHGMIISINASGAIGNSLTYSDPAHIQTVAQAFPDHPIVVTHGAWPYTRELIALVLYGLMLRNANIYFQIDYALLGDRPLPGATDYIDAINTGGLGKGVDIWRKALFGSSFPAVDLKTAADRFARLDIRDPLARQAIGRGNAAQLLGLTPRSA